MKLFILIIILLLSSCSTNKYIVPNESDNCVIKYECHNADSKFINDMVLTSIGNQLTLLDINLNIIKQFDIRSDWVDACLVDDYIYIISGNFANQTHITKLDLEYNVVFSKMIMNTKLLCIDQAIIFFNDNFYFTITEILGNVNNSNLNGDNGQYTIKLFRTSDFEKIEFVKNIVSKDKNLEDIELFVYKNNLAATYEEETAHSHTSTIHFIYSKDELFDNDINLINDGDDEPAKIAFINDKIYLFYASDMNNPGESYDGSDIYCAVYDYKFNLIEKIKLESIQTGIHLYDVLIEDNQLVCLYCINYYSTRDLIVEYFK